MINVLYSILIKPLFVISIRPKRRVKPQNLIIAYFSLLQSFIDVLFVSRSWTQSNFTYKTLIIVTDKSFKLKCNWNYIIHRSIHANSLQTWYGMKTQITDNRDEDNFTFPFQFSTVCLEENKWRTINVHIRHFPNFLFAFEWRHRWWRRLYPNFLR